MPTITGSPSVQSSSRSSLLSHNPDVESIKEDEDSLEIDRFLKMPCKKSQPKEQTKPKEDCVAKANQMVDELIKRDELLANHLRMTYNGAQTQINQKDGHINIALNYHDKDLVGLLEKIEKASGETSTNAASERMHNSEFLLRCFRILFENESNKVTDWLKISTQDAPEGNQLYNLYGLYRDWLAEGKTQIFDPLQQHEKALASLLEQKRAAQSQLAMLEKNQADTISKLDDTVKQKENADNKIGKLVKKILPQKAAGIKPQSKQVINSLTEFYLLMATQEETLKLQAEKLSTEVSEKKSQLPQFDEQTEIEIQAIKQFEQPINLYEKKLALLELLIGFDLAPDKGNPIRVQLIQGAIQNILNEINSTKNKIEQKSRSIFQIKENLLIAIKKHESKKSGWNLFWSERDIRKLLEKAGQVLKETVVP